MATPTILIEQVGRPPGVAGTSRDDLLIGSLCTLTDPANGAGTYAWTMLTRPTGSSATLSGASTDTATFVPDVAGTYLFSLTFDGTPSGTTDVIGQFISSQGGAGVKDVNGTRIPGAGETVQFGLEGWHPAREESILAADRLRSALDADHGSVLYTDASGNLQPLVPSTSGYVLATQGPAVAPAWVLADSIGGNTLGAAYNEGGAGAGAAIIADAGPVTITNPVDDTSYALEITRTTTAPFAGGALRITQNSNATGDIISAGAGVDHSAVIGRARLWSVYATWAAFGNAAAGQHALAQSAAGSTYLNAPAGQTVGLGNNDFTTMIVSGTSLYANATNGPALKNQAPTASSPSIVPAWNSWETGIGSPAANEVSVITNATEAVHWDASQVQHNAAGISANPNADESFVFGRLRIDSRVSDSSFFSHYDRGGNTEYGIRLLADGNVVLSGDTVVSFLLNNSSRFAVDGQFFEAGDANGPALANEAATALNPTLIPDRADLTAGIGNGGTTGEVSVITGATEAVRWDSSQNQINAGTIAPTGLVLGGNTVSDILISTDGASTSDAAFVTAGWIDANVSSGGGGLTVLAVADIDDPSAELNIIAGAAAGETRLVHQVDAATDEWTLYAWDNATTTPENPPYSVDGSSGMWVAVSGKYQLGANYTIGGGIHGDPGLEAAGITVAGGTYQASSKVSDIGGTNIAQFILHRHSTTLAPIMVAARAHADVASHAGGTVLDNDILFQLFAAGWDGVDYALGGGLFFTVDGTPGAGDMPTEFGVQLSPVGSEAPATVFLISPDAAAAFSGVVTVAGLTLGGNEVTDTLISTDGASTSDSVFVTAGWIDANVGGGTLDDAYDFGGAGAGRAIVVDTGAVLLSMDAIGELVDGESATIGTGTMGLLLQNDTDSTVSNEEDPPAIGFKGSAWNGVAVDCYGAYGLTLEDGVGDGSIEIAHTWWTQEGENNWVEVATLTNDGWFTTGRVIIDGNTANPGLAFDGQLSSGLSYSSGVCISHGGNTRVRVDSSTTLVSTNLEVSGQAYSSPDTLTAGATVNTNCNNGNAFHLEPDQDFTLANPTNMKAGSSYTWHITQPSSGGPWALTALGTAFHFQNGAAPTLTAAVDATDTITAYCDGSVLHCAFLSNTQAT